MTTTYRIAVNAHRRQDFDATVKMIKLAGGTYDPNTRTWTLVSDEGCDAVQTIDRYSHTPAKYYAEYMTIEAV